MPSVKMMLMWLSSKKYIFQIIHLLVIKGLQYSSELQITHILI
jgi:hypothetical protein